MTVEALPVETPGALTSTTAGEAASFDERWAAWQAKGAAHDRALRRKLAIAAPIFAIVAAILVYGLLAR